MRALIQRVSKASVTVDGKAISSIGHGLVVLLGVGHGDGEAQARWLA
ncbi:MAG: D-aminoacyl-tRNA deacylase, partial [Chloroflexi bacterium]|nr:D-aminoacyl-tRNA deacylase [Chloroflexota bacterium]